MPDTIYTHNVATSIVELFEDLLEEYNISVPSPEDDDRPDNASALYGMVYADLLDDVEDVLLDTLNSHGPNTEIVPYVYS